MARKFSFDELLAKREQREADKLKVGLLELPGTGKGLEARMPGQKTVLDLYGELVAAQDARESLQCGNHALYACCPQLWDSRLQEELGCKEDPMQVLDKLFSLAISCIRFSSGHFSITQTAAGFPPKILSVNASTTYCLIRYHSPHNPVFLQIQSVLRFPTCGGASA